MYSQVLELVNNGASSKEAEADNDEEEVSNDTNLDEDEFSESDKVHSYCRCRSLDKLKFISGFISKLLFNGIRHQHI